MESLPEPLTAKEHCRVVEIIGREAPHLLPLARDELNTRWLTSDECKAVVNVLLDVFLRSLDQEARPSASN